MKVNYDKAPELLELYSKGKTSDKHYRSLPKSVIKKFVMTINKFEMYEGNIEFINQKYPGLHYERMKGDKLGIESVRLNLGYRIEFVSSIENGEEIITIVTLIKISNHYGD